MRPYGPWTILSSREVYRDPWIRLQRDEVLRPDGAPGSHCILHLKPGVTVLAYDEIRQEVHLTYEFHYAVGRETLEAVSGGIEPGESALSTAQRELREELGIEAGIWTDLGVVDPFTSVIISPTQLYLARQLHFGATDQEGTERIERRTLPLVEALACVFNGTITHSPSCVALLKTQLLLMHGKLETNPD